MLQYIAALACLLSLAMCEGFVEEVSCLSDRITVMLNKSDPDVRRWVSNSASEPLVYVYGYKGLPRCRGHVKNEGRVDYNLTVMYDEGCSVKLSKLEPNYLAAETTIALEDNAEKDASKPIRIHHVFCLYTSSVQALKISDVSTGHRIVASTGGKPKPKVNLVIRDSAGRNIKAAKFGDSLEFLLLLSPDNAYRAISPQHCMFSDKENMEEHDARTLTFVQSSCPVEGIREIVEPVVDIREDIYYTKFQAFRFGNQSTVFAHCKVDVCLDPKICNKPCYHKLDNASEFLAARKLRFRRSPLDLSPALDTKDDTVRISNAFTVIQENDGEDVELLVAANPPKLSFSLEPRSPVLQDQSFDHIDTGGPVRVHVPDQAPSTCSRRHAILATLLGLCVALLVLAAIIVCVLSTRIRALVSSNKTVLPANSPSLRTADSRVSAWCESSAPSTLSIPSTVRIPRIQQQGSISAAATRVMRM